MKKVSISAKSLDPIFEKIEKLTKVQRMLITIGTLILVVGAFVYFSFLPKFTKLSELKSEYETLENDLRVATIKAAKLGRLRKELEEAEAKFEVAGKALPEKEEIPSLLAGISQSGKDSGLEFHLFQPMADVSQDFYAEIPVSITVQGGYHNVGTFFDKVSNLSRIVNMRNIKIKPLAGSKTGSLITSCTAVTYRFIEEESKEPGKGKPKKK